MRTVLTAHKGKVGTKPDCHNLPPFIKHCVSALRRRLQRGPRHVTRHVSRPGTCHQNQNQRLEPFDVHCSRILKQVAESSKEEVCACEEKVYASSLHSPK